MRRRKETDKNPVGIDFDPEDMVERVRSGLKVKDLVNINA